MNRQASVSNPCYITASSCYCENVEDHPLPLGELVERSTGKRVRRISRFIQLALIGAARAAQNLPPDSSVYLSSGRGDMEVTLKVLNEIYRQGQAPRPLSFINTVSNASCYYIAQSLALCGPSFFVTNRYTPLETALFTAHSNMRIGRSHSALVGAVDVVVDPLHEHRQRLALPDGTAVAEGSHWLQLSTDRTHAVAHINHIQQFHDESSCLQWLRNTRFSSATTCTTGQHVTNKERETILMAAGLSNSDEPVLGNALIGHFDSRAGYDICQFLAQARTRLLYINRDSSKRYTALTIEKC